MFINIITPCVRPENLHKISKSINIPKENYRWIVVCDSEQLPNSDLVPDNCEVYIHKNPISMAGNDQRNFALSMVKSGHLYFNDDDTTIHPELWDTVKDLNNDFISFTQNEKSGQMRLKGDTIWYCHVDSHNILVSNDLVGDIKWHLDNYGADGRFAVDMFERCNNYLYIPKVLSIYNTLR